MCGSAHAMRPRGPSPDAPGRMLQGSTRAQSLRRCTSTLYAWTVRVSASIPPPPGGSARATGSGAADPRARSSCHVQRRWLGFPNVAKGRAAAAAARRRFLPLAGAGIEATAAVSDCTALIEVAARVSLAPTCACLPSASRHSGCRSICRSASI